MAEVSALTPSPPAIGDPHASPSMPLPSTAHPAPCSPPMENSLPKSPLYNDKALKEVSPATPPMRQAPPTPQRQTKGLPLIPPKPALPKLTSEGLVCSPVDGDIPQSEGVRGTDVETGGTPGAAGHVCSDPEVSELLKANTETPAQVPSEPEGRGSVEQTTTSPDLNPTPNLYPSVHVTQNPNLATDAAQSVASAPPAPAAQTVASPPPTVASPPPTVASPPPTVASPPPTVASPPPTVTSPPPTVASPPPTVASPPPTVASPPPTVTSPPPTVTSPPPTVASPPPTVTSPPPTVTSPPPTVVSPPPTVVSPPPTVVSPPPTVASPPPTVVSPPPTVASPPPTVASPPPTVASPPPTVASPPPTVASPPPTVASPPPTVASPPPTVASPPPTVASPPPTVASPPPTVASPPPTVASPPPCAAQTTAATGPAAAPDAAPPPPTPEEKNPRPPHDIAPSPPHPQTPPAPPPKPETPSTPSRTEHPVPPAVRVVQEPAPSVCLPSPRPRPAPDTLSYLESASLMSGTLESLSGLGEDGSSVGSDSEVNGLAVRRTDKYGFLGGTQYSEGSEKEARVDVSRQREMKWLEMFNSWDKWISRRFPKVKLRCRKGIPSSLRCKAWQLLSNSQELLDNNPGKFEELEREPGDPKWLDIIEKDLHRQFPFHEMFVARGGHGQQDLYRILKAYTVYRPEEGYCQAQAPVAAVLLMHMPAEHAFWCLVQICEKYLPGYYSAGLEAIQLDGEIFFSLLRRVCPMAYRHLKKFKIDPILYMTEWFMCVFSRTLPWPSVLRVWDMFFCEGVKIVFRVGLVLLKQMLGSVDKLRAVQGMYETMECLRNIPPESVREDLLVQEVVSLPVTEALIERECSIQMRKWKESRGELTHQAGLRLHGTRAIHEYKRRASAISSGGSFSFLGGSIPPPGPLRASSSLLSLPGFRRSKGPFHSQPKKGSFSGFSGMEALPPQRPSVTVSSPGRAPALVPPASAAKVESPLVGSSEGGPSSGVAQASAPTPALNPNTAPNPAPTRTPTRTPAPPNTLSPVVVSEQVTPSIPSPTANNALLPPLPDGGRGGAAAATSSGGEEDGKRKKKSKDDKRKEKEEEKQKLKEKKEKEKADKERQKKEKERAEKEKKKEKGGKRKDKGGGGEAEEKNGAAVPKESA